MYFICIYTSQKCAEITTATENCEYTEWSAKADVMLTVKEGYN